MQNNNNLYDLIAALLMQLEQLPTYDGTDDIWVDNGQLYVPFKTQDDLKNLKYLDVLNLALTKYIQEVKANLYTKLNGNIKEIKVNDMLLKCVWQKDGKTRVDIKALREQYPDLVEQFTVKDSASGYVNMYFDDDDLGGDIHD